MSHHEERVNDTTTRLVTGSILTVAASNAERSYAGLKGLEKHGGDLPALAGTTS